MPEKIEMCPFGCNIWETIHDLNESYFYDSVLEEESADLQRVEK